MAVPSLTKKAVEGFVVDVLEKLGIDREQITLDASFDDLGVDSLHVTELGQAVNREFDIQVHAADLEDTQSLREALGAIYVKAGL
ncbi:acyl carrier protein [Streptomyces sp. NBC_01525]|uniref:Acyl carrier protein n=1 Tax=Streptomyces benahoarensis TaxID=2595054 RepID=A0A553ZR19_9ACTN|nr:acyl carrier protein [Streptomyces benahoarensis]TSB31834.1 acyl carrier protein [Streptomyces benahoarensis]TSB43746.1 acyl carrier protein [Streptomyces benahoarensis]